MEGVPLLAGNVSGQTLAMKVILGQREDGRSYIAKFGMSLVRLSKINVIRVCFLDKIPCSRMISEFYLLWYNTLRFPLCTEWCNVRINVGTDLLLQTSV